MSQPSQPLNSGPISTDTTGPLASTGTTSAHLAAVRLKSANKYIFRALLSLASAALLIRVAGLLNQIVVSGRFGAGAIMDAYFVASTLPILLAQLLSSAIETSVIPVYARIRAQGKKEQASILFSTLLNSLVIGTALLTIVMLIFRRQMILISAPALDAFRTGLAVGLAPFIFPVLLLMVVISFFECILNTEGQFGWPAYAGMLVPLTTAILVFTVGKSLGVVMLCVGMVIGLCLQLGAIILRARRAKLTYRFRIDLRNPAMGLILMAAWPVLFSAFITQAAPLVDQIFASFLSEGNISALNYALKLNSVPVGVIFVSVGRAALPYLSRQASMNDMKAFKETLRLYLWAVGISTLVLTAFMIVLARPIVEIFFERGAFTDDATNRTAITLIGFTIGLTPMSFTFIITKAFSALGKNRILLYITVFTVLANAFFDYLFAPRWQSVGIALSTSAVYFCTTFILLITLRRMIGKLSLFTPPSEVLNVIWKVGIGSYYIRWVIWKEENLTSFSISSSIHRKIIRASIIIAVFVSGVVGAVINSLYTLRIAFGLVAVVILLRYPYILLIIWVLMNALNGMPVFRGTNVLVGLTVPLLLLMVSMPIRQTCKRLPALAFLFVYLTWVFASIGISAIGVGAFLTDWTLMLDCMAIGVLTINVLNTRWRMLRLIDTILLLAILIALYGIYGYITKQTGVPDTANPSLFRTSSIFGSSPTTLALFLSAVIPLALYRVSTLQGFKRAIGMISVFILLVTLGLTFTRAAYISVLLSIIVMTLFLPSRKMKIAIFSSMAALATLIVLVATIGNLPIFNRFFNQDVTTLNGRTYLWQAILGHVDPTQLLGNGLHASDVLLTNLHIGGTGRGLIGTSPHSLFLGTLYDHGIIGVSLLALIFIMLVVNIIAGMRKATGDHSTLFAMALAVTVSVLVQSIESNDFWGQVFSIYFWIIIVLPFAHCWFTPKQSPKIAKEISDEVTVSQMQAIQQKEQEQISYVTF